MGNGVSLFFYSLVSNEANALKVRRKKGKRGKGVKGRKTCVGKKKNHKRGKEKIKQKQTFSKSGGE